MNKDLLVRIVRWGLYICPLAILLYINNLVYPLVTLKVFGFNILVELLVGVWALLAIFHKEYRPRISSLVIALSVYIAALILSSLLGVNIHRSFWSVQERAIGIFSILHFYAYFLVLTSMRRVMNWRVFLGYIFSLGFFVGFLAIIQKIAPGIFNGSDYTRPGSYLGNPAFLAPYLMFNMFLGGWLAHTSQRKGVKIWLWIAIGILGSVIFLGQTRGAILGLGLGILVLLGYFALRKFRPFSFRKSIAQNIPLLIVLAVLIFGGVLSLTRNAIIWQRIPGLNRIVQISATDTTVNNRLITWKIALDVFASKPIFGYGWENFKYPFDARYNPSLLRSGFVETYWDKPHNVYLELLATAGVIGLLAYLYLIAVLVWVITRRTPKEFRPFAIGAVIAYLAQNFFVFDAFGSYCMFFMLLAVVDHFIEDRHPATAMVGAPTSTQKIAGWMGVVSIAGVMILGVIVNVRVVYANHLQFWGLNYFVNRLPDLAVDSFKSAVAISQPYENDLRQSYLSSIAQVIQQLKLSSPISTIDDAYQQFAKAIAADPNNYYYYVVRADASTVFQAIDKKYLKGIEEDVQKAIGISPTRQQNYYVLSKVRLLAGDKKGAIDEMQKAVALDPEAGDPHFLLGLLLLNSGDIKNGLSEVDIAKRLGREPKNAPEARIVAGYFGDAEQYERAADYYRLAIGYDQNDYESELKLGVVLSFIGANTEAATYLRQFLIHVPDFFMSNPNAEQFKPIFEVLGIRTE